MFASGRHGVGLLFRFGYVKTHSSDSKRRFAGRQFTANQKGVQGVVEKVASRQESRKQKGGGR
jgi:hypothetical protein